MAESNPGAEGEAAIAAYREALRGFTEALTLLHISCGAPSYRDMGRASVAPKLTGAGITEALTGRRLPSQAALLEFVRVARALAPEQSAATLPTQAELMEEWSGRWQKTKLLQRQAQAPLQHLRATVNDTLHEAEQAAQKTRNQAREEAAGLLDSARTEAERLRAQARDDAHELLRRARQDAAELSRSAKERVSPGRSVGGERKAGRARRLVGRLPRRRVLPVVVAGTVVLTGSAVYIGVDAFGGHRPGSCTSALDRPSRVMVAQAGPRTAGVVEQAAGQRLPDSFITVLPGGAPFAGSPSASPTLSSSSSPGPASQASSSSSPAPSASTSRPPTQGAAAVSKAGGGCE
ncbi:DivIVA domain-containing protein [Streptomyces sp. NPDC092370]|uniref:DivIVA domain-containing protein n=1 Tax=Streptomyces sp. NPDC092370 TaxID=3366016 RepID=UPI00380A8DF0